MAAHKGTPRLPTRECLQHAPAAPIGDDQAMVTLPLLSGRVHHWPYLDFPESDDQKFRQDRHWLRKPSAASPVRLCFGDFLAQPSHHLIMR